MAERKGQGGAEMLNEIEENNRAEHLKWCKERALEYVNNGDPQGGYASFMSDMRKNPHTAEHPALLLGMMLLMAGHTNNEHEMRRFIEGFN